MGAKCPKRLKRPFWPKDQNAQKGHYGKIGKNGQKRQNVQTGENG